MDRGEIAEGSVGWAKGAQGGPLHTDSVDPAVGGQRKNVAHIYNQRPTWLDLAHRKLDEAVATAYGWPADLTHEQILERLLALNLERSSTDFR